MACGMRPDSRVSVCSASLASQRIAHAFHRQHRNIGVYARVVFQKHQFAFIEILDEFQRVARFMGKLLDRRAGVMTSSRSRCMRCPDGVRRMRSGFG